MSESLSAEEVARIAELARLELNEEQAIRFSRELSAVLDHVAALSRLDTADVAPAAHPLPLANVLRADEITAGVDRDEVLAAAPAVEDRRFLVPRIVGEAP